jgi:hypothetical protein
MKSTHFKQIVKEAVREAIQEELKDILLEAIKSPKTQNITESQSHLSKGHNLSSSPTFEKPTEDVKQKYADIMGETALNMTSRDVPSFAPQASDPISGNLGGGELSMNQITNLLNNK